MSERKTVFAREATGLVREIGAWPSFMATFGLVTGGVPIAWVAIMYTAPGANWPLAFTIAFLPTLSMAGLLTIVGMSMPRSGGDYVFTSRALGPFVGFINYWGIVVAFILCAGLFEFYGGEYFGYLFSGLGAYYSNASIQSFATYITGALPSATIGIVVVVVSAVIAMMRPSKVWRFVFWAGVLSLVATIVMFVALSGINQGVFSSAYNSFMDNSTAYQGVITSGGLRAPSSVMLATAAALPFTWFSFTWYNLPLTWAGETKNVKKSVPIAVLGGVVFVAVYYIAYAVLATHAFGQPFLDNWSGLSASGNAPISGIGGFVPFFALLVFHNPALYFLMFFALWFPDIYALTPFVVSQTRYVFAFAFDRTLPDKFASVNDRFHTPVVATLLVSSGIVIGVILASVAPGEFSTALLAIFTFGFVVPAIAGIVFPYSRKQIYETAFVVKKKLLVPVVSLLGLASLVYLVYSTYLAHETGSLPIDAFSMTLYGVIYGIGAALLVGSYLRNQRRGLRMDLIYKEIPPE